MVLAQHELGAWYRSGWKLGEAGDRGGPVNHFGVGFNSKRPQCTDPVSSSQTHSLSPPIAGSSV